MRTYYRWCQRKADTDTYDDLRPAAEHLEPANKLTQAERQQVIDIVNDPEYASMCPL